MPYQDNWRYCQDWHVMFFAGYGGGRCAGGGSHRKQGFNFVLPYGMPSTANVQGDWRYCESCHAMFFAGHTRVARGASVRGKGERPDSNRLPMWNSVRTGLGVNLVCRCAMCTTSLLAMSLRNSRFTAISGAGARIRTEPTLTLAACRSRRQPILWHDSGSSWGPAPASRLRGGEADAGPALVARRSVSGLIIDDIHYKA
jgi:hypothetical protein